MIVNLRIVRQQGGKLWHYGHFCHDFLFPVLTHLVKRGPDAPAWTQVRLNCINPNQLLGTMKPKAEVLIGCPISEITEQKTWLECRQTGITLDLEAWNMVGWQPGQCWPMQRYVENRFGTALWPYDVVLIERSVEPLMSGIQDTGANRRAIENHAELADKLEQRFGESFLNVRLEGMHVLDQIELFRGARVIIGQHGAGLCNAAWNRYTGGSSAIIELPPRKSLTFVNIATALTARYCLQHGDFDSIVETSEAFLTRIKP